jgi:hypothetical protein
MGFYVFSIPYYKGFQIVNPKDLVVKDLELEPTSCRF